MVNPNIPEIGSIPCQKESPVENPNANQRPVGDQRARDTAGDDL